MRRINETPTLSASEIIDLACSNGMQGRSLLIAGPTGVGKSQIVQEVGRRLDMEVIDIRLAIRTEGDLMGLPKVENGITTFMPPAWVHKACKEPVVLFLDEINRAERGVSNIAFQIVLDRALGENEQGQPHKLHPGTVIVAAINEGFEYSGVNEMDPALMRRFAKVNFRADFDDWVRWARSGPRVEQRFDRATREVVEIEHETMIEPHVTRFLSSVTNLTNIFNVEDVSKVDPSNVFPTPASWEKVSEFIRGEGMDLSSYYGHPLTGPALVRLYRAIAANCGYTAAGAFDDWMQAQKSSKAIRFEDFFDKDADEKDLEALVLLAREDAVTSSHALTLQICGEEKDKGLLLPLLRDRNLPAEFVRERMEWLLKAIVAEQKHRVLTAAVSAFAALGKTSEVSAFAQQLAALSRR